MKKLIVVCIAALGAALLVGGLASPASAYPDLTCQVTVTPQSLRPGEQLTVTGTTPVAVDAHNHQIADADIHWTFSWDGVTKTRTGRTVSATFTAPHVKKSRTITLTARNTNPISDCVKHFDVTVVGATVLAPHGGGGGGLPSTGGPTFWLLVAGLVLLLGGGGAVVSSRRRG